MSHFDMEMQEKKRLAILGSTGSIGIQTLEIAGLYPALFDVEILTAHSNTDLLIQQALTFHPNAVIIGEKKHYQKVKDALAGTPVKVFAGADAITQVVEMDTIDMVVVALVGFSGVAPTLNAIEHSKAIALANKETMVVAGDLITAAAVRRNVSILPIDSEHSAIFQCLEGEYHNPVEKIILTASGGPFLRWSAEELENVGPEAALQHPNWKMGNKITIDSATLMNKGLEVIEAHWLFGLDPKQIEVVIHPQSIIHSLVQFQDGSLKAQLGLPDMKLPILYALTYPYRVRAPFPRLNLWEQKELTFEQPDLKRFPNLELAYRCLSEGGIKPCVLNAANEIAVSAFLTNRLDYFQMTAIIENCLENIPNILHPTLNEYIETDRETRLLAQSFFH